LFLTKNTEKAILRSFFENETIDRNQTKFLKWKL